MPSVASPPEVVQARPSHGEGRGLAAAFLVALGLHAAALALLAGWRSAAVMAPPGEQEITIDLAPSMIEVPAVMPVETRTLSGIPAETIVAAPPEELTAQEVVPEAVTEAQPVEAVAVEPPPAEEVAPLPAQTVPLESTALEAVALPPPETIVAELPPAPKPIARPEPKRAERVKPRPVQRAARSGEAGESARETRRGLSSRENTGGSAAASADPNALARYAAQLAGALKGRLRYPDAARAAGLTGVATLRFTLNRSGRVLQASITRSSGHVMLDQAALATASPGQALPPPPDGVPQPQITISVPLRFDLR